MDKILSDGLFKFLIEEKNLSEVTSRDNYYNIAKFIDHIEETGISNNEDDFISVNKYDLRSYFAQLENSNLSRTCISEKITSIRIFFEYLEKNGGANNPSSQYIEDVLLLLNAPDLEKPMGIRDRAILETLYGTGMSLNQLVRLNHSQCDVQLGLFTIQSNFNSEDELAPIGQWAQFALENYFDKGRPYLEKGRSKDALFISNSGQRITERWLKFLVSKYIKQVVLENNISPQKLRNSFATHLVEGGSDVNVVKGLLGKVNLSESQLQTSAENDKQIRVYRI